MAYQDYEISAASGEPIELYNITDSDGGSWRYHTGGESVGTITYLAKDFVYQIVERSSFSIGNDKSANELTLTFTKGNLFAKRFIEMPVDNIVSLTVYRQHVDTYATYWQGYLVSVSYDEDSRPTCRFQSVVTSSIRMGTRRRNSRMCPYLLYEYGCNVNQESFRESSTLTNISADGLTLTSANFANQADGYWQGGKIRIGSAWRLVKSHTTNTIIIDRKFYDAEIGDTYYIYAGCDHTAATCKAKFANQLNFGGNAFLPKVNPFQVNTEYVYS